MWPGFALAAVILMVAQFGAVTSALAGDFMPESDYPEREEILDLLQQMPKEGLLLHVYEQDEEALQWVLPRILVYVEAFKKRYPELSIVIFSHGAEMPALSLVPKLVVDDVHQLARQIVRFDDVIIQVCGAQAIGWGLSESDFPDYVDVVPHGPTQIRDYLDIGYDKVDIELTW